MIFVLLVLAKYRLVMTSCLATCSSLLWINIRVLQRRYNIQRKCGGRRVQGVGKGGKERNWEGGG